MSMLTVKDRFKREKIKGLSFKGDRGVSKTQQNFRKECDINTIMARYRKTGMLLDPSVVPTRKPFFGDFSKGTDFHTVQLQIVEAQNDFNRLPVMIREKFNYDPAKLIDFVADPKNRDEAISMGLIDAPSPEKRPVDSPESRAAAAKALAVAPVPSDNKIVPPTTP